MIIYLAKKAQLFLLFIQKVTIPAKYLDFVNNFLKKSMKMFFEYIGANKHFIDLRKDK